LFPSKLSEIWRDGTLQPVIPALFYGNPLSGFKRTLNYELDTKVFYTDIACFLGAFDGSGFAPVVYEMPGM